MYANMYLNQILKCLNRRSLTLIYNTSVKCIVIHTRASSCLKKHKHLLNWQKQFTKFNTAK